MARPLLQNPYDDFDTCIAEDSNARARVPEVRIKHRDVHSLDAGRNQCLRAGWRSAVEGAGLQRDIGVHTDPLTARLGQDHGLRVVASGALCVASTDHNVIFYQYATDCGFGKQAGNACLPSASAWLMKVSSAANVSAMACSSFR